MEIYIYTDMHTRLPGEIFTAVVVNSNVTSLSVKVRSKINILRLESSGGRERTFEGREREKIVARANELTIELMVRRYAGKHETDPRLTTHDLDVYYGLINVTSVLAIGMEANGKGGRKWRKWQRVSFHPSPRGPMPLLPKRDDDSGIR